MDVSFYVPPTWVSFAYQLTTKKFTLQEVTEKFVIALQKRCPQTMLSIGKLSMPFEAVVSGHYVYL